MLSRLYRSALGLKALMAVSGIVLFGFVLVHMAGNLKLYLGPEAINHYGEWLREVGTPFLPPSGLLWVARVVLLASVLVHIVAAWKLTWLNRAARPQDYVGRDVVQATYAARTMRWGGVIILLFVLYHLADLTFGWVNPDFVPGDVYHNMVAGFSVWWVSAFYMLAQVALAFHLYHGLWSLFQSLGWNHPALNPWRRRFAATFAIVVAAGNLSFPLAVLSGLVS
ncbi:MAG: succinate dehydrogenase cytochrome b subunit [Thermoanaerobaculia bacterium]